MSALFSVWFYLCCGHTCSNSVAHTHNSEKKHILGLKSILAQTPIANGKEAERKRDNAINSAHFVPMFQPQHLGTGLSQFT